MTTLVFKTSKDVNSKADDSSGQQPEADDVAKEVTLAQRLQSVVDAGLVPSLSAWGAATGLHRTHLSTYMARVKKEPDTDIGCITLQRLADKAGVTRRWLLAGDTLSPERADADQVQRLAVDQVEQIRSEAADARDHIGRLLRFVDAMLGIRPEAGATRLENTRAFTEAVASSDVMRVDKTSAALDAARMLYEAGRVDTKRGWSILIDQLAGLELVAGTLTAEPKLMSSVARLRPRREHESQADLSIAETEQAPPVSLSKTKKTQRPKKRRART